MCARVRARVRIWREPLGTVIMISFFIIHLTENEHGKEKSVQVTNITVTRPNGWVFQSGRPSGRTRKQIPLLTKGTWGNWLNRFTPFSPWVVTNGGIFVCVVSTNKIEHIYTHICKYTSSSKNVTQKEVWMDFKYFWQRIRKKKRVIESGTVRVTYKGGEGGTEIYIFSWTP